VKGVGEFDETEPAFSGVERHRAETFLGTELRDRQTAIDLPTKAFAP
jgi:hypothetical protein